MSATYVTPYPPGFPVLVPGQVFSREILQFMRDLDTKEIHGYEPNFGYRVYTEKAIEMVGASVGLPSSGHQAATVTPEKPSKKKPVKRGGNGHARADYGIGYSVAARGVITMYAARDWR